MKEGSKVSGFYYGQAYTGSVIESRPHTAHRTRIEHTVQLDAPITVYSQQRRTIIVATHDNNETCTINLA